MHTENTHIEMPIRLAAPSPAAMKDLTANLNAHLGERLCFYADRIKETVGEIVIEGVIGLRPAGAEVQ